MDKDVIDADSFVDSDDAEAFLFHVCKDVKNYDTSMFLFVARANVSLFQSSLQKINDFSPKKQENFNYTTNVLQSSIVWFTLMHQIFDRHVCCHALELFMRYFLSGFGNMTVREQLTYNRPNADIGNVQECDIFMETLYHFKRWCAIRPQYTKPGLVLFQVSDDNLTLYYMFWCALGIAYKYHYNVPPSNDMIEGVDGNKNIWNNVLDRWNVKWLRFHLDNEQLLRCEGFSGYNEQDIPRVIGHDVRMVEGMVLGGLGWNLESNFTKPITLN
jgi:hypothetical protein